MYFPGLYFTVLYLSCVVVPWAVLYCIIIPLDVLNFIIFPCSLLVCNIVYVQYFLVLLFHLLTSLVLSFSVLYFSRMYSHLTISICCISCIVSYYTVSVWAEEWSVTRSVGSLLPLSPLYLHSWWKWHLKLNIWHQQYLDYVQKHNVLDHTYKWKWIDNNNKLTMSSFCIKKQFQMNLLSVKYLIAHNQKWLIKTKISVLVQG